MKTPPIFLCVLLAVAAIGTLSGCKKEQAAKVDVSAQVQELKSPDADKRANACVELAKAGEGAASATSDLIPLCKDKDPLVRRLAVYALGQIGPKASSALPSLKEALGDSDSSVSLAAVNALRSVGDTNANVKAANVMSGTGAQ